MPATPLGSFAHRQHAAELNATLIFHSILLVAEANGRRQAFSIPIRLRDETC
jgi:hypothetical protein